MNIVFMNGGLGNQTFQYIYMRNLELLTGQLCIIDDSPFFGADVPHDGYELEKVFGIRHKRLSELFDPDVWEYMISQRTGTAGVAQELLDGGMQICMIFDNNNYRFNGEAYYKNNIPSDISARFSDIYHHGYWLGNMYFVHAETTLRQELIFPPIPAGNSLTDIRHIIEASADPVCIHIRRGDMARLGWCQPPEYYAEKISSYSASHPDSDYFLFSDEPEWCLANSKNLGLDMIRSKLHIITDSDGQAAWMDLSVMTGCHSFITDRSSFSLLAWALCEYNDKKLISNWK